MTPDHLEAQLTRLREDADHFSLQGDPEAVKALVDVALAASAVAEAIQNPDRDWLGLPPEGSDEWGTGYLAALVSVEANTDLTKILAHLSEVLGGQP